MSRCHAMSLQKTVIWKEFLFWHICISSFLIAQTRRCYKQSSGCKYATFYLNSCTMGTMICAYFILKNLYLCPCNKIALRISHINMLSNNITFYVKFDILWIYYNLQGKLIWLVMYYQFKTIVFEKINLWAQSRTRIRIL